MSKLVFFKDLRKRSADVLTKEFPGDKVEKKLTFKGDNAGGSFEAVYVQDEKGTVTGTVKPKLVFKDLNTEVSGEVSTKQEFKVEISAQDHLTPGLKFITGLHQKKSDLYAAVGGEYKHENVTTNFSLELGKSVGPVVNTALSLGKNGYSFGLSDTYLVNKSKLDSMEGVLSYRTLDYDASVFGRFKPDEKTKKDVQEIGFNYFHIVKPNLHFSTEGVYGVEAKNLEIAAGMEYKQTSDSTFKGKFTSNGNLGLSLQQQLNQNTKFTLSSNVDLQNFQSGRNPINFGFEVSFSG